MRTRQPHFISRFQFLQTFATGTFRTKNPIILGIVRIFNVDSRGKMI
ncbi:hypothetical protein HOLDEFILI_02109 [Holdemania filiformis DSM 12042]|uniref:Uncharacterized protein n=1 Tax=Holdemania filiformis DSM 12042 TaxID=545696 RepID=B9Y8G2_9FIRM|nr:hypothetical protein HOLDEFILI_02109 [Holdemania filiformis DSM 12042]